jgi:hypothetical protein
LEAAAESGDHVVFERTRVSLFIGDTEFRQDAQDFPRFDF